MGAQPFHSPSGHLCVCLRLNGIPMPALYGPSTDEQN